MKLRVIKDYLKIHYPNLFSFYQRSGRKAKWWARNSKRLDLCAAQFAYMMHYIGNPFQDNVCLELGSGWVLSHAILAYLLGAKKVIATDYIQLANLEALKLSIELAEESIIRDILAPYQEHEILRERLVKLRSIKKWSYKELETLGIEYKAPLDLSRIPMELKNIDFLYSLSVLEHIPFDDVKALTRNLSLAKSQFHFIHLEDHANLEAPFDFLELSTYSKNLQLERGKLISI